MTHRRPRRPSGPGPRGDVIVDDLEQPRVTIRVHRAPADRVYRSVVRLAASATLLVMGGSQGASGINQAVIKSLPFLHNTPLQMIHLTGKREERLMADNYQREKIPAYVAAFHHRMEEVYSAADFVIARSGAASLSEFAAFGLPGILIPFPYASDDHQTRNAEIFARAGAAFVLKELELSPEVLAQKIREMIDHPEQRRRMSEKSSQLAPRDAANRVAATMEKYTRP